MRIAIYTGAEKFIDHFAMIGLYKVRESGLVNLIIGLSQILCFVMAGVYR